MAIEAKHGGARSHRIGMNTPALIDLAISHHRAGRLADASRLYAKILRSAPEDADALHLLGLVHHQRGEHRAAAGYIERAVAVAPRAASFRSNLGAVYQALGELEKAVSSIASALEIDPANAKAHFNLGCALQALGRLDEATGSYRAAIRLRPDYADAQLNLGNAFRDQGKLLDAVSSYRRAIELRSGSAEAHNNLGSALRDSGYPAEALSSYRRAVSIDPGYVQAHRNLGLAFKELGRVEEAAAAFETALGIDPDCADALADLVQVRRAADLNEAVVRRLQGVLARAGLADDERRHVHFALGDYFDRQQEWDAAFAHYRQGNALVAASFDRARVASDVDASIATFTGALLSTGARIGSASNMPVFIVGMPRSGTSLVEQILASHPRVAGAGELPDIRRLARGLQRRLGSRAGYPECAMELERESAQALAAQYLSRLRTFRTDEDRVTDKMPGNFLQLGLIALLFPNARVIHCRRDPLDVCVSCYFQNFRHTEGLAYTFDLRSLGEYYAQYARLMEHWRRVLPLSMLEVHYEEVVDDPERAARALIDFCGLRWDPVCLQFHTLARPVRTASALQVRRPVYRHSVRRWKHYERHLGPLKDALACGT